MDIINSAEGTVANFITNLAKPLASSKYGIEAMQDLNGQTGPYPPGGGKNLLKTSGLSLIPPSDTTFSNATKRTFSFDSYCLGLSNNNYYQPNKITSYSISENSVVMNSSAQAYGIGMPMTLEVGVRYNLSFVTTGGKIATSFYSLDGTALSFIDNATNNYYFTVPEDTAYVVFVFKVTANGVEATFSNIQVEKGSSATTWAPYSNICPIVGADTVNGYHRGKNLLSPNLYKGLNYNPTVGTTVTLTESPKQLTDNHDGTFSISTTVNWEMFCMIVPIKSTAYYRKTEISSNGGLGTTEVWLDKNLKVISTYNNTDTTQTKNGLLTIPNNASYFAWVITNRTVANSTLTITQPQLELGSSATVYEPYQGEEQSISLVPALYTLYPEYAPYFQGLLAGTHDFVELGSLLWGYVEISSNNRRFYSSSITNTIEIPESTSVYPNIICTKYKTKLVSQYIRAITGITIYTNGTIQIYDSELKSLTTANFKTAMSGVYIIYKLATPKTPTITEDQFKMLLQAFGATCYGGEVITTESGARKLKVDKKIVKYVGDSSESGWCFNLGTKNRAYIKINDSKPGSDVLSNYLSQSVHTSYPPVWQTWINSSSQLLVGLPQSITTLEDWKNYLSLNPLTIVYELATPLIIDLPDGLPFSTYIGTNNIFCDTGDTSVDFYISVPMDGIDVNMVPGGIIPTVNVSQSDSGRKVRAQLLDGDQFYTIPEGYIVTGKVLTTGKEIVDIDGITAGSNYVDLVIPDEATALPGTSMCKLRVKDPNGTYDVGFSIFFIEVEQKP